MNKKGIIGIILVAFIALGTYYFINKKEVVKDSKRIIKIGAVLPETNKDYASYAKQLKKGMLLAEELINNNLTDSFNIIYEDGFGVPNKSISALNKLIDIDKVNFVIGPMFSHTAESMTPVSLQKEIVLLSPSASSIQLSKAGKYFFRIYPSDSYDGTFLADFTNKKFANKKIAIVSENSSSINQIVEIFKKNITNDIVLEESINGDNLISSLGSIIVKLKELNPKLVFFPGNKNFMSVFLKKCKEQGVNAQFITISTFNDEEILNITKETAEGVLFSTPSFDINSNTVEMNAFIEQYKNKYREVPDILAGYGYDVVNIAYLGLQNGLNSTDIISNLHKIKNYKGVTGNTSFDSNGDVIKQLQMMIVKDGEFAKYE